MPLAIPKIEEVKSEFISRCMEDEITKGEFPNVAQRIAVCNSQWDKKDNKKQPIKTKKDE